jgi:DNA polymerase I-like protein with 3'-5' exonuclease and polymerase domains
MRPDAVGFFWEDETVYGKGKKHSARVQPPIPETGWKAPNYFPDLSGAPFMSLDTETYDPDLLTHGPGWARGVGHIVGVSISVPGGRWYFPMRHTIQPEDNIEPELVLRWLRDTLGNPNQPKVGANILYDIGWLEYEGVKVRGELVDVQYAEALLDERAKVSLEQLGQKYLREGKDTNLLYQWCSDYYGGMPNPDQRANIYRAPPCLVGSYAESDADLPLRLAPILYRLMQKEGLVDLFRMECRLIRLMIKMRMAGVRVDIPKAEETRILLQQREIIAQKNLDALAGSHVDINTNTTIVKAFDKLGLTYPRTKPSKTHPHGQPSFTRQFLESVDNPVTNSIREIRRLNKLRTVFIESYILKNHVNSIVYGQFHLLRGDKDGTRSGRFSSSTPNLQNIPSRDKELANIIRGLFVPDEFHPWWRRYDYSQIEYRFLAHYACGPGSDQIRARYNADPTTDYHELTLDMVAPMAGWDVSTEEARHECRKPIKTINFGLIYGMGPPKLARSLGLSLNAGRSLFGNYHRAVPFAKATMDAMSNEAKRTGVISTILGRKSRFDLWGPAEWSETAIGLPLDKAIMAYGNVTRAYTHKALNRKLQGSAADLMKTAMDRCETDGIFDATGVPRLTVHDELDFSDPGGRDEAFMEMQHTMQTCMPLRVPIIAGMEIGTNWGNCH